MQLRNCALIVLQLAQQTPRVVPLSLSLSPSLGMASAYARIFGNRVSASVNPISAHLIMPYRKQLNVLLTRFDYVQRMYKERARSPLPPLSNYIITFWGLTFYGAPLKSPLCAQIYRISLALSRYKATNKFKY